MNTIDQVQNAITEVEKNIGAIEIAILDKQKEIDSFEYEVSESEFDDFLDDVESSVVICGMEFQASDILKSCDPIAYRCAKNEYESDYDLDNCEEYTELQDELEALEDQLSELESELDELNDELESLEDEQ